MVYKLTFKIVVWFIIAIARFRFPRNESIPTILRRRYGDEVIKSVRKFEKTDRKLRKAELDLTFLQKCVELSLTPKFLNFKVTNDNLRNSNTYIHCQKELLNEEIVQKNKSIEELRNLLRNIKSELQEKLNVIDYAHVLSCFLQSNDRFISTHRDVQDKKLNKLIEKTHRCHNDPSKVIHNFSSYELNDIEKSLLVRGLNFSICPGKLNYADYCINFEYLFKAIKTDGILSPHKLDFVKTRLKDIALSSYKEHNSFPYKYSNLSKEEAECLKKLSENKNLVIQKSDKGNAIVILNREDYVGKVKELLSDSSKFKVANVKEGKEIRHLMNVREDFKQVIDELLRMEKITQQTYWKLDPIGCKPGVLYGLSKVHKTLVNGLPKMRPILSAIGTAGYNVSKFLLPILDSVANGPYTIINTFSFNKEVQLQDANLVMGSLDVDALFTNIPLDETINICVTELFKDKELINMLNMDDVRDLLKLASKNT